MIVIAFAQDVEIGIDIEFIKTDFDPLKLAESFFSKNEIIALKAQSKEELGSAFFRCWTRKEFFIKAEGSGLSFPLDKFTVSLDSDHTAELLKTDWDLSEKDKWNLFSFSPSAQYLGAIAARINKLEVTFFEWNELSYSGI
jgi:4'-phosphopantetheinyl transferase